MPREVFDNITKTNTALGLKSLTLTAIRAWIATQFLSEGHTIGSNIDGSYDDKLFWKLYPKSTQLREAIRVRSVENMMEDIV